MKSIEQKTREEINQLIEAKSLANERLIEISKSSDAMIYGHSFCDNGMIQYQFHIQSVFGKNVVLQMYSFLSGDPTSQVKTTLDFIKNDCALYLSHENWLDAYERNMRDFNRDGTRKSKMPL